MQDFGKLSQFVGALGSVGGGRLHPYRIRILIAAVATALCAWPAVLAAQTYPQLPEDYLGTLVEPPPLDPPDECPFYKGAVFYNPDRPKGNPFEAIVLTGDGEALSCLETLVNSLTVVCDNKNWEAIVAAGYTTWWKLYDECILDQFWGYMHSRGYLDEALWRYTDARDELGEERYFSHSYTDFPERAGSLYSDYYFDDNCVPLERSTLDLAQACDALVVEAWPSPISLIWDETQTFESEVSITSFPLDPSRRNASYIWKASDKAPLLVYDPEHTGEITSAAQLFGNWTFGGKRLAALGASNAVGEAGAWENGFEALATLDTDGNGRIDGEELEPLGLWFDKNRDGVAQAGEVQSAREAGLLHLFYSIDFKDEETGSLYVRHGFERLVDGVIKSGKSVDWYGEPGSSRSELLSKQLARGVVCHGQEQAVGAIEAVGAVPAALPPAEGVAETLQQIKGLWQWKVAGENGEADHSGGLLAFSATEAGELHGTSVVELPLVKDAVKGVRSMATMIPLSGFEPDGQRGGRYFRFIATGKHNITENSVKISSDGKTLFGESRATVTSESGREQSHSYRWSARRITK